MKIVETKIYTIDEHPNKKLCFENIRNNSYDLNEDSLYEFIDSLKSLQDKVGGKLDYSISTSPCRGEFISFEYYDLDSLNSLEKYELPLTGLCWDYEIIEALQNGDVFDAVKSLHNDTEYVYSDEGLEDFCIANNYEFDEEGNQI